ncbi:unnamed protein product [Pylaiella littoralis]
MSAVAARCFRAIPTRSMLVLSKNSPPSAKATIELLVPRSGGLVRRFDGTATNALAWSAAGDESLGAVMPTMEAVNRNARRPKKANHGKRPCSHVGRRYRRRSKKVIKNAP